MVCRCGRGFIGMDADRLKSGILGIDGCGRALIESLLACPSIELIALADRDRDLAKDRAAELHIEAYDDYRSLIVEQPLDALFVATPPFACHEHLKLAASRGIHVWRETPMARSVHEGADLIRAFEAAGARLAVARRWWFVTQAAALPDLDDLIGTPYAARGEASERRTDPLGWRGNNERAGGGVLIDRAYELVDAIVKLMHLPDEVQATTARRSGTRPYDTEDVASVTLRYQNGAMATILAHRRTWQAAWSLIFDGPDGSVIIEPPTVRALAPDGTDLIQPRTTDEAVYDAQIEAFAQAVLADAKTHPSLASDHLATMAVIETAYLSARTGEPESPSQLYHLHDLPLPTRAPIEEPADEVPEERADEEQIE